MPKIERDQFYKNIQRKNNEEASEMHRSAASERGPHSELQLVWSPSTHTRRGSQGDTSMLPFAGSASLLPIPRMGAT